jgi:hypothetical protein
LTLSGDFAKLAISLSFALVFLSCLLERRDTQHGLYYQNDWWQSSFGTSYDRLFEGGAQPLTEKTFALVMHDIFVAKHDT